MNEQEAMWKGPFGNDYNERNQRSDMVASNMALFAKVLERTSKLKSIVEFGCGTGQNLQALDALISWDCEVYGVEINEDAAMRCPVGNILRGSMFDVKVPEVCELVFTKGFLIHVAPDRLEDAFSIIANASSRYVMFAEYHSPRIESLNYRGQDNRLWKGPYAEMFIQEYPCYELIYTTFVSKLDKFPQDDLTVFLMRNVYEQHTPFFQKKIRDVLHNLSVADYAVGMQL